MSTANHYRSNLRDIAFNLFEVLDLGRTALGRGPFAAMDEATAREALTGLEEMAQQVWAPDFVAGDREGARFDGAGNVTLPAGTTRAIRAYYDGGWNKLELPEHLGGYGAPPTVAWAAFELLSGANPSATFYLLGNFLVQIIDRLGSADQKARFVTNMIEGHWGGTMVLTEPDAGSDVGAGTTRARHVAGDEYELTGVKRFITNGDFDHPANIVHLVLARPEGAGPGTKGLSLFIVPKVWVEADGSLGARNGAVVTSIEHKMGLRASATCELTLGADTPCRGLLVGGKHDGIAQMFQVIEYARMGVGTKSMATLSTAYLNALDYTRLRKQGADLARAADKTAPRVEIIRHPDVRRMLMLQKAFAEGLRSMVLWTASLQDQIVLAGGHGSGAAAGPGAAAAKELEALNDLMLPLIKGYGSEKVYELLAVAAVLRRLGVTARTIRSSSTSAIRRSTRCTRARRTSRPSICSSARSGATRARRCAASWARSGRPAPAPVSGPSWRPRSPRSARRPPTSAPSSPACSASSGSRSTTSACRATASCSRWPSWSSAGAWSSAPRSRWPGWARPARPTAPSTAASWRRPASTASRCCPGSAWPAP